MHLYRGELWTRGIAHAEGLELSLFGAEEFDAVSATDREHLFESLETSEDRLRALWSAGDTAVLARINGRPAGIAWCSQGLVHVPELDRNIDLGPGEAYIHDVFVAPVARGRSVAPSMLEFLASELRGRDVYKSWALIGCDNIASTRAFEKAAYAAVCDVIYARMAAVDKLVVRPPDPDARKLLGLDS
jgi:GNAT superfamily N-acetyltransferase